MSDLIQLELLGNHDHDRAKTKYKYFIITEILNILVILKYRKNKKQLYYIKL